MARASAVNATADSTAPMRCLPRPAAHRGSTTSMRPARNACVFIWTDTPLRTIASSMAAALTGMAPAWCLPELDLGRGHRRARRHLAGRHEGDGLVLAGMVQAVG